MQASIHKVKVFDMDGTIVDSSGRYRTITDSNGKVRIDLEYWLQNEYRAMEDGLLPLVSHYRECLRDENTFVIIATARVMYEPDYQFVREILGEPNVLISRKPGDTISGSKLKINGLQRYWNLKQFRRAAWTFYEDNASYLKAVCDHFDIRGVYIPSKQGH